MSTQLKAQRMKPQRVIVAMVACLAMVFAVFAVSPAQADAQVTYEECVASYDAATCDQYYNRIITAFGPILPSPTITNAPTIPGAAGAAGGATAGGTAVGTTVDSVPANQTGSLALTGFGGGLAPIAATLIGAGCAALATQRWSARRKADLS